MEKERQIEGEVRAMYDVEGLESLIKTGRGKDRRKEQKGEQVKSRDR